MKRVLGHCLAGLGLICAGISAVAACTHNDSSLFIQNVIAPTPVAAGQTCTYTADPTAPHISSGTLDVGFLRREYQAFFLLGNQLVQQSNSTQLKTETSNINIEGVIVRDTDTAGNQLDTFTNYTAGTVYASTGAVPGYTALGAVIASEKAVSAIGAGPGTVVTYTKFFGHTLGGTYIESNEFEFPVDVCTGCLVSVSAADNAASCANGTVALPLPNCFGTNSAAASLPVPCVVGQDDSIDCSYCVGAYKACRLSYPDGPPSGCTGGDAGGGG